ncbi:MAG TPA: MFS transporter [Gaiellaceae bacterium]|nr:MFS transporter [Gaiellaceae bacterium]
MGLGEAWRPLAERPFRLLWLGRVSSQVGDAMVPLALSFAVLSVDRSGAALGAVLGSLMITRVVFTLAGGVIADRLSRRTIMLGCDLTRGGVHAFTAAMLLTHHMTILLFVVTEAIFGTASAFFNPAADGLIAQSVTQENLRPANALLGMSRSTVNIFGPSLSGVLVALAGSGYVFAIDAASFALSAFFLARLHVDAPVRAGATFVSELKLGFREVATRDWVRAPLIGFGITNFALAAFLVLGPIIYLSHFHDARVAWGITSTCGSLLALVGGIISVRFKPRHPLHATFVLSILVGAPLAALAGPLPVPILAAGWGAATCAIAVTNIWWETALQQRIPEHVYSRVRSYDLLASFVFMPIGMFAFGPIGDGVGYEWTLLGAAALIVVTNLAVAFMPGVRTLEQYEPATAAPATA